MGKLSRYLLIVLILLIYTLPVRTEDVSELLNIPAGQSQLMKYDKVQRVAVTDPTTAEVVVVSAREILVNGIKAGVTTLHIWAEDSYKQMILRVFEDNTYTAEEIALMINKAGVEVTKVKNSVILRGTVLTQHDKEEAVQIAGSFAEKVVDLLKVAQPLQVLIKAYVVEVNREKLQELGLEWGGLVRGVFKRGQMLFGQLNINGLPVQLDPLGIQLKALAKEQVSHTLAEPEIVALSGSTSQILVGGEIPVIKGGDIIWKPYGIILTVKPAVLNNGQIQVQLEPEVSTVDWDNALKIGDYVYPAFKTRRVQTQVTIEDGSTIVLGGLINQDDIEEVNKVPFLGDLPIIGELFQSRQFRKGESEVVVMVQTWILTDQLIEELYQGKKLFIEEQQARLGGTGKVLQEGDKHVK